MIIIRKRLIIISWERPRFLAGHNLNKHFQNEILNFAKRPRIFPNLKSKNRLHQFSLQNSSKSGKTTSTPFFPPFHPFHRKTNPTVRFSTSKTSVPSNPGPKRLNPPMFLVHQSSPGVSCGEVPQKPLRGDDHKRPLGGEGPRRVP